MGKKYIVKLDDNKLAYTAIIIDGVPYIKPLQLLPYTEPDLEQMRKEAFEKGYSTAVAEQECAVRGAAEKGYQKGLEDAWEAARKIGSNSMCSLEEMGFDFSQCTVPDYNPSWFVVKNYSASECIEKIRQYEQKQEEQDGLRQNIQTIVDQCGYTLDEIAEVLQKMKESDNG